MILGLAAGLSCGCGSDVESNPPGGERDEVITVTLPAGTVRTCATQLAQDGGFPFAAAGRLTAIASSGDPTALLTVYRTVGLPSDCPVNEAALWSGQAGEGKDDFGSEGPSFEEGTAATVQVDCMGCEPDASFSVTFTLVDP